MLERLSMEGRALFEKRLLRHSFGAGQALVHKGDPVSGAYFVIHGRLRVFTYSASGREATLYTVEPGETCVLALNSLFNDVLYPAWVETDCHTEIGILPGPVYRELFSREAAIQDLTVHALSTAVFRLMAELEQLHASTLDQRIASFLLTRANGRGEVRLTHQQIAGHVGSSREVVSRLLNGFADRGWVETRRGAVRIADSRALGALLQEGGESHADRAVH